jgi:glycolate oxidase
MNDASSVTKALHKIQAAVGVEYVAVDEESRLFYSTDVYRQADVLALAVVSPGNIDELQTVVRNCAAAGFPLVTRGGGASYTDGYLAIRENTICIDTSRLNRISINEDDMYVTAEAGVTWQSCIRH